LKILIHILVIYCFVLPVTAQVSVVDDAGNRLRLEFPAKRVVALAPHLTEIIYAIKAESSLVATVSYSNYPIQAKSIPRVGGYNNIDLEAIISYKPDLVVAWKSGNNPNQIEKIKSLGIPVFLNEPRVISDVARTALRLGTLMGVEQQANHFSNQFQSKLLELKHKYQDKADVTLFYQIWHQPIMTVNGEHLISDAIRTCGASNIFADVPVLAPTINIEAVLKNNPEMIVAGGMGNKQPDWLNDWKRWPELRAVKNHHLYFINSDLLHRHGPRILQGTEILCKQVEQVRNRKVKK
jgi:iron complex transport system substrate-binding protein